MKTLFTFNEVTNDAGQLAFTEGHAVLTSSPRVSPRDLLSFGRNKMKKIYYRIADWFIDRTPDSKIYYGIYGQDDYIEPAEWHSFRAIVTAYFVEKYKAYKANKKSLPKPPNWK